MTTETSPGAVTPSKPPVMWFAAGGLALLSLAAAAAMVLRAPPEPQMVPLQAAAKPEVSAAPKSTVAMSTEAPPAAHQEKQVKASPVQAPRPVPAKAEVRQQAAKPAPEPVRVAAICSYCGVIEAVDEVKRKGEGTGLGAIAGGVLGAAAGNQVGRGDGRKAMTILGAVGGGIAGHEVEKRARGDIVYQVRIRFEDGSVRTIEQATAPRVGARVEVHGNELKSAG
jgi:outer membrane lipoprotein SlyB